MLRWALGKVASLISWYRAPVYAADITLTREQRSKLGGAKIEIIRDAIGCPHISADSEADLFFGQGFVHAQDRLWQMETLRRVSLGTMAELSEKAVALDVLIRTFGFARLAKKDELLLQGETKEIIEAYIAGINFFMESPVYRAPVESTMISLVIPSAFWI